MTRGQISGINVKKKEWTRKPQLKFVPPHLKNDAETKEEREGTKAAKEAPLTRQRDEEEGRETKAAAKKKTAKEEWEEKQKGDKGQERGEEGSGSART